MDSHWAWRTMYIHCTVFGFKHGGAICEKRRYTRGEGDIEFSRGKGEMNGESVANNYSSTKFVKF